MSAYGRLTLLLLALPALAAGYSEEDWRAFSRTKVQLVDTFDLPFQAAGPIALLAGRLVFLSRTRDSLIGIDTLTRAVVSREAIAPAWNMDVSAIAGHEDRLYLLSRSTRCIYRYEPDGQGGGPKVLVDLGAVRFDGEPALTSFACDGRYVYLIVQAGFNTHIARVAPPGGRAAFITYATGNPCALWLDSGVISYICHRDTHDSRPVLERFRLTSEQARPAAESILEVELPCRASSAVVGRGRAVWCTMQAPCRVARMAIR